MTTKMIKATANEKYTVLLLHWTVMALSIVVILSVPGYCG